MNKKYITICVSLFYLNTIQAQTRLDSTLFLKHIWKNVKVSKGVAWQYAHFKNKEIFNSNQNINIVRVSHKARKKIWALGSGGDSLFLTSILAKQNKALVAINGSFFDVKNGGAVDFIKIDGKILDTTRLNNGKRAEHQKSAIVIEKNTLKILRGDKNDIKWDEKLNYDNIIVTGPILILNNKPENLPQSPFNNNRHPRSCVCITSKNETLLVTIDGRTPESQGVSLPELTQIMTYLGCKEAINLDGGGSTTLYIAGQPDNGVVNMPCDNKKFDHAGERKVSNIIYLKDK